MGWRHPVYATQPTSSVALRRQLPLIGEAIGVRSSQASPSRGGGSAKPRRRGRGKFDATSQSRLRRASIPTPFVPSGHFPLIGGIGPWKGSPWGKYEKKGDQHDPETMEGLLPGGRGGGFVPARGGDVRRGVCAAGVSGAARSAARARPVSHPGFIGAGRARGHRLPDPVFPGGRGTGGHSCARTARAY